MGENPPEYLHPVPTVDSIVNFFNADGFNLEINELNNGLTFLTYYRLCLIEVIEIIFREITDRF